MDRFLLDNAALYRTLVKGFKPTPVPRSTSTSSDIIVSARVRPLIDEDVEAGFPSAVFPRSLGTGVVDIHDLYNHPRGRPILKSSNYQVDRLFDSQTTTEEIYENLVVDLLPFTWNGGIGTLFAYGQTGSGKTFTVSRIEQLVAESLMKGNLEGERRIYMTIIDLGGNSAYDLLNEREPISILEDSFGVTQLAGAVEHIVKDEHDMMSLIMRAASFRRTAPTFKNDASSRSHAICRIRIYNPVTDSDGYLYLIDLAGSEAARDVAVHGADRMRETREINISLSVLKDCIRGKVQSDRSAKSRQKKPHIPFRSSALTKVLKHVFDPNSSRSCKTVVIACVNPSLADTGPSKNTLRYAELLRVQTSASNKTGPDLKAPMLWTNAQLKSWISKNSGTPSISPTLLAPTESGAQLLHLPSADFESRCLKTPGVSIAQAGAFRSKIWQLHVDSQHGGSSLTKIVAKSGDSTEAETTPGSFGSLNRWSSRDLNPNATGLPFQERIRPGMVVSLKQHPESTSIDSQPENTKMVVILCPSEAAPSDVKDRPGDMTNSKSNKQADMEEIGDPRGKRFLCAMLMPGLTADAYELNIWSQAVIDVNMMEKEVIIEYDAGTRYYYVCL
ncbi:hypothetical protein JX265_006346 [Neoarthrinium moseri]|uniref:Kinesin motor domain-containing protein n=1 Tax=Neoarthrinium moseri TaxID=1658444 RepID=A0A9P9WMB9_9PEZI|nr:hypothetical protein JX265_006346 [Neoarthrinium moseri]